MSRLNRMAIAVMIGGFSLGAGAADGDEFGLQVDVVQRDQAFHTTASFRLPLNLCQAYRYLVDYDAAKSIPGVIESRTARLGENMARVERVM